MTEQKSNNGCAVALGNFDGLHIGHQKVLGSALEYAKKHNLTPKVMLFDIHPKEYILKQPISKLLSAEQTEKMLQDMGFEICKVEFAKIRHLEPEDFFENILINKLSAKALFCGFNYSFGKNGKGNSQTLSKLSQQFGISSFVVEPVEVGGVTVSSTAIRNYIMNGEPERASEMLGRNYCVCGEVVHCDGRGRTLGFPTANQEIGEGIVVPEFGVYKTKVLVDGKEYSAITNIGIRPTFRSACPLAETNILDFNGDIYGKSICVELIKYLRGEVKFNSAEELALQLEKDIISAKN